MPVSSLVSGASPSVLRARRCPTTEGLDGFFPNSGPNTNSLQSPVQVHLRAPPPSGSRPTSSVGVFTSSGATIVSQLVDHALVCCIC
ncbi:hypothetical protein ZWY2020_013404 [Hordeum vulgare]|nr:hypothetical protein ZWY2020_013404 [Hordeum vulgare]